MSLRNNNVLFNLIIISIVFISISPVFSRYFVRDYSFDWKKYESEHFEIYFYADEAYLLDFVVETAEDAYIKISDILDYKSTKKVPLIIYSSHQEFEQTNLADGSLGEGVGGFTEMLRNRVVVPFTGSQKDFTHVLTHELVHAIIFQKLFHSPFGSMLSGSFIYPDEWFMEGLPEFISEGWDPEGRQVLKDAVVSGDLHNLKDLKDFSYIPSNEVYLAYKEGQSAVEYLADTYGVDSITKIVNELKRSPTNDLNKAIENTIGMKIDEFNEDWQLYLRRKYLPQIDEKETLKEYGKRLSTYEQREDYIQFLSSDFTPSAELIACLSNTGRFLDIVLIDRESGNIFKNLTEGKGYDEYNYIQYAGKSISVSEDGDYIAFVVREQTRDRIYIIDILSGDIIKKIKPDLDNLISPSFSPDGRYIAFAGLKKGKQNIYIYDLETDEYRKVVNTPEACDYPSWSPDGKSLVFYVENLNGHHLFLKDLENGDLKQLTFGDWSDIHPSFTEDGKEIIFVSNRYDDVYNIFTYSLETKQSMRRSNLLIGANRPVISPDEEYVAFTGVEDSLFTVCVKETPLPIYQPVYDETEEKTYGLIELTENEELLKRSKDYSIELQMDYLQSSFTYTTGGEFRNYTQVVLSDTLSNHRFGILFDLTSVRSFDDIDAGFIYLNLAHRATFGFLVESWRTRLSLRGKGYYERLSGGTFLLSYPFSQKYSVDISPFFYIRKREFIEPYEIESKKLLGASITFNRDTTLYGYYHPTSGSHQSIHIEQGFPLDGTDDVGEKSFLYYTNIIGEMRKYFYITQRNSFATRLVTGTSLGRDAENYYLCGADTIRGYPLYSMYGNNFVFANAELRFPIIDAIFTSIPQFILGGFRGVLFVDAGTAWSNGGKGVQWDRKDPGGPFKPWITDDGFKFHHLRTSFGFGFRLPIFYMFDLRLDYAWTTNLQDVSSKPYIHFSIGTEW